MSASWPMVKLGEVLRERKETPTAEELSQRKVCIVAKIGFNDGRIKFRSDGETKTNMILIRPGDMLISGINAGKGAIAIYPVNNTKPAAATIHYSAYSVCEGRADMKYLWWFLRSNMFRDILAGDLPEGIKTELKPKRLLPLEIPLPHLSEQRRIAAQIEALAIKIAEAHSLRQQSIKEIEAFTRSLVSTVLFSYRVNGTLSNILLEKPRNGWSAKCDNAIDSVPVLALSAVTGFHYCATAYKRTSEPTLSDAHYWLNPGDLLITRSNSPGLVGHAAIYSGEPYPCIYSDLMMRLPVDHRIADTKFVWLQLQTTIVRDYIANNAKGTSPTMKKISQGVVMGIPFPTEVPLPEQRRIVAYLDGLQAKVNALKALQAQTAAELDAMLPSILDKAFKGAL